MAAIQVVTGKYDATCTTSSSLLDNSLTKPHIAETIMYAEQRNLITYIVSGAKYGPDTAPRDNKLKTKIGMIPKDKLIGNQAYQYNIMGRIQKSSVIVGPIGTVSADGDFQLIMADNQLYPGHNVSFGNVNRAARVTASPTGHPGNYVYRFKVIGNDTYDYTTWVGGMSKKELFGGFTTYGEKSVRGYSRSFYPDRFIGHTTIQRKSTSWSGNAAVNVLWLKPAGVANAGWIPEKMAQLNKQLTLEDEHGKMWARTNMRNADGSVKNQSDMIDEESGFPIVQGMGLWEQIEGINDMYTTGVNGKATYDDFRDMMNQLKQFSHQLEGNVWYAITGSAGLSNAIDVLEEKSKEYNITINQNGSTAVGGPDVSVGYNFRILNVEGNQVIFCEHAMMTDRMRWQAEAIDSTLLMEGSYMFLNMSEIPGTGGQRNIEIMGSGAYGINRTFISAHITGMSGMYQKLGIRPTSSVDGDEYHTLKEDGIFVYLVKSCGILHRSAA